MDLSQHLTVEQQELVKRAQGLKALTETGAYQSYKGELFRYLVATYHGLLIAPKEELQVARALHAQAWDFYRMVDGAVVEAEILIQAVVQKYEEDSRAEREAAVHPSQQATHALNRIRGAGLGTRR